MSTSLTHLIPPSQPPLTQAQRLLTPTTQPIPLLASPSARIYTHLHTVLVVGWVVLVHFSTLVAQPLDAMLWDLVVLGAAQCVWCALCLPAAGTWASGSAGGAAGLKKKSGAGAGKGAGARDAGGSLASRVMPTLYSLILALSLPPLPLTLLTLVLGAPLWPYSLLPHTLLLSLHVSLLAFMPLFYTHGVSSTAWRDVLAAWLPFDEAGVWGGSVGCLVGGWVGAVPIALDWDRDWQAWPVTVVVGCYLGWAAGRALTSSLRLGVGKRINLSEADSVEPVRLMKKTA